MFSLFSHHLTARAEFWSTQVPHVLEQVTRTGSVCSKKNIKTDCQHPGASSQVLSGPVGLGSGASETGGFVAATYGQVEWFFGVLIHHLLGASSFIVDSGCHYPDSFWSSINAGRPFKKSNLLDLCVTFFGQKHADRCLLSGMASYSPASRLWRQGCKNPVNTCIN